MSGSKHCERQQYNLLLQVNRHLRYIPVGVGGPVEVGGGVEGGGGGAGPGDGEGPDLTQDSKHTIFLLEHADTQPNEGNGQSAKQAYF